MKSVIHEEFASGTFLQARAQALSTKSFTDSLYAPFESKFSCFRTLKKENHLKKKNLEKRGLRSYGIRQSFDRLKNLTKYTLF